MPRSVRALRGATTVDRDDPVLIRERVQELLETLLEDNDITGNISFGLRLFGNSNTVIHNFITRNPAPQVQNFGVGNLVGTPTSTEAGSDSWSNISYP